MPDLDSIDKGILMILNKNSRSTGVQISKALSKMRISLTDRAVLQRIARLEAKRIIQAYTITLNPSIITEKSSNVVLIKFCPSADSVLIEKLDTYLLNSSFCLLAARIDAAEFDYICLMVFDNKRQFDLQLIALLRTFRNLISGHQIVISEIVKNIPYMISFDHSVEVQKKMLFAHLNLKESNTIKEKLNQFVVDMVGCFDAKYVCLRLLDCKTNKLINAFDSGTGANFAKEYASISESIDMRSIFQTMSPVLTTDIVNDVKDEEKAWAATENLRSYTGYPLSRENQAIGVLEIFSDRAFSPRDFEMASMLCEELSRSLTHDDIANLDLHWGPD
jgi:DNA-binding Lrp family transcriptional regulator